MNLDDLPDDGCRRCGGEIDMSRPHASKRLFCSPACLDAERQHADRAERIAAKERQGRICAECGGPIAPAKRDVVTKYCSLTCQRAASESVRVGRYPLTCRVCEAAFHGHYAAQRYCGNRCKSQVGVAVRRARAAARRIQCEAVPPCL